MPESAVKMLSEAARISRSDQKVLATLRRMITYGTLKPGEKISEVGVASMLGVSRTPARLALTTLEVEGFITKRAGRGYTIKDISLGDISKAFEVRGVLEGLAARLLAQKGLTQEIDRKLVESLATTERAIQSDPHREKTIEDYQRANMQFHETIMAECGNDYVGFTHGRLANLPLMKLGVLVFNRHNAEREMLRLTVGHTQHVIIYDAIANGDGGRAEAMMREHSNATIRYSDLFGNPKSDGK